MRTVLAVFFSELEYNWDRPHSLPARVAENCEPHDWDEQADRLQQRTPKPPPVHFILSFSVSTRNLPVSPSHKSSRALFRNAENYSGRQYNIRPVGKAPCQRYAGASTPPNRYHPSSGYLRCRTQRGASVESNRFKPRNGEIKLGPSSVTEAREEYSPNLNPHKTRPMTTPTPTHKSYAQIYSPV